MEEKILESMQQTGKEKLESTIAGDDELSIRTEELVGGVGKYGRLLRLKLTSGTQMCPLMSK